MARMWPIPRSDGNLDDFYHTPTPIRAYFDRLTV